MKQGRAWLLACLFLYLCLGGSILLWAQTASTGGMSGTITDPAGAVVPDVEITVANEDTGEVRTAISGASGRYRVALLPPGSYRIEARKSGFKAATRSGNRVVVTETTVLDIQLELGTLAQTVTVETGAQLVQTESSALGRVADEQVVTSLPLNTRNFTQIIALSPGVTQNVTNAAELGRGMAGLYPQAGNQGVVVHGTRTVDNNFQLNGVDVNDWEGVGEESGGIPLPNPDTLQEFKVQTGQFDAVFGRNAGANINIVTKSGSNEFHGTVFHFFRNEKLNANDFFFNRAGEKKPVLRQNQFGFTLGGPVKKDKLLFFGSYQGTRQKNGVSKGGEVSCAASYAAPLLTDDRSPAALGALFGGLSGVFGGVAVAPDGSNIHPVALQILNLRGPDGGFLLPSSTQVFDPTDVLSGGLVAQSKPCTFDDDQFMVNLDLLHTEKSKLMGRFFYADSTENVTFSGGNVFSPRHTKNEFRTLSLSHSYVFSPTLFNEVQVGLHRSYQLRTPEPVFQWSDLGIAAVESGTGAPSLDITGTYLIAASGSAPSLGFGQTSYSIQDTLSYVRGAHSLRLGGGFFLRQNNFIALTIDSRVAFLSFPDFLLGLDGASNGTGLPNILFSLDFAGLPDSEFRSSDGFFFAQDDIRLAPRLTLNLGVRYERIGTIYDNLGRRANFDLALADPNPPAAGTLEGYMVAANFPGTPPPGVTQTGSKDVTNGKGKNNWAPRIGFAWQVLPQTSRLVVRGGYGIYYSRPTGQQRILTVFQPPFGILRVDILNPTASWDTPFALPIPSEADVPVFPPYSPTTALEGHVVDLDFRPGITQQWSLNLQTEFAPNFLLEVGYVGTKGTQLTRGRTLNQAELASASNPIRGETTNTLANLFQRVPIQGWSPIGLVTTEAGAFSWYNALEASVTKRMSNGLQFLASYTWAKHMDSEGSNVNLAASGNPSGASIAGGAAGDNNNDWRRYGPTNLDRRHRFVFSYLYELPSPVGRSGLGGKLLSGWALSGVTTFQSGQAITLVGTNAFNVFGILSDHAQIASGCTSGDLVNSGSVTEKLDNYFNSSCIADWPVIGDDGLGTDFGNSGTGIVRGPDQRNFDIAIVKKTWINETLNVEFRAEFFNAFNTTQFRNPDPDVTSPSFGRVSETAVNPRVLQFALKLNF